MMTNADQRRAGTVDSFLAAMLEQLEDLELEGFAALAQGRRREADAIADVVDVLRTYIDDSEAPATDSEQSQLFTS